MKRIWAPWRIEYITGKKPSHCIFCREHIVDEEKELVLHQGRFSAAMMNKFPYNNGHILIYPWKHTSRLEDMEGEETLELFSLIRSSVSILKKEMNPDGFNIGMNLGKAAGAGIEEHIHFHIVPRWNGDTNFMPVVSEVRVLSEHLHATYDKLYPHFQKIKI